MDESMEEDFMDAVSDTSTDSAQDGALSLGNSAITISPNYFDQATAKTYARKVRALEHKILMGQLSDADEGNLRKSKHFTSRFEKLLKLSSDVKKANLYKLIRSISLNEKMMTDLKVKADKSSTSVKRKLLNRVEYLRSREKAAQRKLGTDSLTQKETNNILTDPYFVVKFGESLVPLDHDGSYHLNLDDADVAAGPSEEIVCDYCRKTVESNRFGQREELLICKDCGNKAHPSCLSYSPELVEQIRVDDSWQCIDCKACIICDGTGDPDTLLFCDACDKGYHMTCHDPKLDQMPSGKWVCSACVAKGKSLTSVTSVSPSTFGIASSAAAGETGSDLNPTQEVYIIDDDDELRKPDAAKRSPALAPVPGAPLQISSSTVAAIVGVGQKQPPLASHSILPVQVVPIRHVAPNVHHPTSARSFSPNTPTGGSRQPVAISTALQSVGVPAVSLHTPIAMSAGYGPAAALPLQLAPRLVPVTFALVPNGTAPQVVQGRGIQNAMTNILDPKSPLPDVRSSIREDVLRSLPPDVADWTVQDVGFYFKSHGYDQEGAILEEQEVDGRGLLLMSRNDVLAGLRLKLGPALKIYHMHIHKLQSRTDFLG